LYILICVIITYIQIEIGILMFDKLIESLAANPCYLAIVSAMIISYFIIRTNNKHLQEMEKLRISQYSEGVE